MIDSGKIKELTEEFVSGTDMFLVDIKHSVSNDIEVIIDSDTTVSIDKCVELSRIINDNFDREVEDFELTVASFGIGQPVKLLRQYKKMIGKLVDVVLKSGIKISATLSDATEDKITIAYQEKQLLDGKKRKQTVDVSRDYLMDEIKSVMLQINFK